MVGANDRVWNALEKLAVAEPECFVDYYASDGVALAATAWLGPAYQVTSQLNVVKPGGAAQSAHRDYHLGFMTDDQAEPFPGHAHLLSSMLTLQGAVAHCDMPVESGPTKLLPHSQKYPAGYVAWRRPDVIELFEERQRAAAARRRRRGVLQPGRCSTQPAPNHTNDIRRMANLLQMSSAFGRAMESIDRTRMVRAVYPALLAAAGRRLGEPTLHRAIAATRRGLRVPDEPRPRPADRRPRTGVAGRHRPPGVRRPLDARAARRRARGLDERRRSH